MTVRSQNAGSMFEIPLTRYGIQKQDLKLIYIFCLWSTCSGEKCSCCSTELSMDAQNSFRIVFCFIAEPKKNEKNSVATNDSR